MIKWISKEWRHINKIRKSILLAKAIHEHQTDRSGEPYIKHAMRVQDTVAKALPKDTNAICAAVLHDAIEDGPPTIDAYIESHFGTDVFDLVQLLSHTKINEPYPDYIRRIAGNSRASVIKIADLYDNTDPRRSAGSSEKLKARYDNALEIMQRTYGPVLLEDIYRCSNLDSRK